MFPIIDPKVKPTTKAKIFVSILWKQLSHLGNAGFDPAMIRVDAYGNVLYYHADSASPLAWDIDHWFPCSRGGLTVLSNLRILQRQVCKRKKNKVEFLVPWWDFQLGISVNQFLSIFASSNSDFRIEAKGKGILQHHQIIAEFEEIPEETTQKLTDGAFGEVLRSTKEAIVLPPWVPLAVRPRPGVWEYLRVNVHALVVEKFTPAEFLHFKEELVDGR